jgi:hypothetical protein
MNHVRLIGALAVLSLTISALGFAQDVPEDLINDLTSQFQNAQQDHAMRTLAEDMEVFSTITHENVQSAYRSANTSISCEDFNTNYKLGELLATPTIAEPLFDYLPGHGVNIQMRIPALRPERPKPAAQEGQAVSRWEETRKRLRGEKTQRQLAWALKCESCHQHPFARNRELTQHEHYNYYRFFNNVRVSEWCEVDGLQEWILNDIRPRPTRSTMIQTAINTLAENGHNLRGLQPHERVTISLSYWETELVTAPVESSKQDATESGDSSENEDQTTASKEAASENPSEKPPEGETETEPKNAIDALILEKLKQSGLQVPDENGDDATLIHRLYLDLAGVPPTVEQVREFLNDGSADAYQRLVDRLLTAENPHWNSYWKQFIHQQIGAKPKPRFPSRTRISVSATSKQLAELAAGKLSRLDFTRQVEVRAFSPGQH